MSELQDRFSLWLAIEANDLEKVEILVRQGVTSFVFEKDSHYQSATNSLLGYATQKKRLDLLEILYANGHDLSPQPGYDSGQHNFTYAAQHGAIDLLDYFLSHGVPINARNEFTGDTILHIAAHFDRQHVIQWAVEHGIDINLQANNKHTALMVAVKFGTVDGIKHLLGLGANPDIPNNKGHTPLDEAIDSLRIEVVELLLDFGARLTVDPDGIMDETIREYVLTRALNRKMQDNSGHLVLACRPAGVRL